jgi:hypothetical protein
VLHSQVRHTPALLRQTVAPRWATPLPLTPPLESKELATSHLFDQKFLLDFWSADGDSRRRQIPDKLKFLANALVSGNAVRLDMHVRPKLIWYSIFGGVFITLLAIALRAAGIYRPVPYLTYSGAYLMQAFFQRFLEWIPWKYADNLISELLLFFVLNVLGYAFVIFLLLRIFYPDGSGGLPPLTGKK